MEMTIFGPDSRDIKDYFRKCSVMINEENRTEWFLSQVEKIQGLHL